MSLRGKGPQGPFLFGRSGKVLFSFGFSAPIDLLSWVVALMLSAKLIATLVLLLVDRDARDRPGWGPTLWLSLIHISEPTRPY